MKPKREFVSDGSVTDNYAKGWKVFTRSFGVLIGIFVLTALVAIPQQIASTIMNNPEADSGLIAIASLFSFGYSLLILTPVGVGATWAYLRVVRQEDASPTDMFTVFSRNYGNIVLGSFLMGLFILLGVFLLIIPGIIIGIRLSFTQYLLIDEEMGAMEAIRASWEMTKGHGMTIFLMGLLSILIGFAGLLALVVGIIPASLWISVSYAVLYHSVALHDGVPGRGKLKNDELMYS